MNKWFLAFAAAGVIGMAAIPNKAEAQVYVHEGARYCFYVDGWQGPGWYRCGYRWRQGLGWGGGYDWGLGFGWRHHGWEKRRHVHDGGRRFRGQTQQSGQPIVRGSGTVQQPSTGRGSISRGTSPDLQGGTTGVGPSRGGSDMRGGQGGTQGGMNAAPGGGSPSLGASPGGGTSGGMGGGNVGGGAVGGGGGGGGQQKR
jgi:hypothetical protein